MNDFACRNELAQRERRGELSEAERLAHAAHLGHCESCRLTQQLGRDFDESTALEGGDGARIAALAETARQWALFGSNPHGLPSVASVAGRSPAPTRRLAGAQRSLPRARVLVAAAALCLLSAAGASAAFGVFTPRVVPSSADDAATTAAASGTVSQPRVVRHGLRKVAAQAPALALVPASPETAVAPPARPRADVRPVPEPAASLFQRANEARRAGEIGRALALYGELARAHPSSQEAGVSELRVASLLLERGKAGAALEHFDKHLRRSGALVPEALYGRGRALAALDEAPRERQTWLRLLREFPGSPYTAHARRRLEKLGE